MTDLPEAEVTAMEFQQLLESTQPTELINGVVVVSPSPIANHQRLVRRLLTIACIARGSTLRATASQHQPYKSLSTYAASSHKLQIPQRDNLTAPGADEYPPTRINRYPVNVMRIEPAALNLHSLVA